MACRGRDRRARGAGLALVGAAVMAAAVGPARPATTRDDRPPAWPIGSPRAIAVEGGSARFAAPSAGESSRTLVVVSALTTTPGAYPIRVRSRPAEHAETPTLADDGPTRPPHARTTGGVAAPPPATIDPPAERAFHLPVRDGDPASPSNYAEVRGRLKGWGRRIQVYVDAADFAKVSDATVRDAVSTFDEAVFPRALARGGPAIDVDGDGRFTVLFSGWLGHLADGKLAVDGFVRGVDFEREGPPIGNRCDMMALNAALESGPHLRTVLAHEYTHAITYCRKALGPARADEEGWLDEALAHLAEDEHGFSRSNLDYRVEAFLAAPERYRLVVDDYASADLIRSHGHRGSAYRFLRWCADASGPGLFEALLRSDLRGVANLEAATGRSFASLYRGWSVGLFLDAIRPGADAGLPPAAVTLRPGGDDEAVLDATTSHYVIVDGSPAGAVGIEVSGPPEAHLQVTAVPLPEDYPRLDLDARLAPSGETTRLAIRIRQRDGRPVILESLRWSPSVPPTDPAERARQSGALDRLALLSARPPGGRLTTPPIATGHGVGERVVTILGRDERGRKVVARSFVVGMSPR